MESLETTELEMSARVNVAEPTGAIRNVARLQKAIEAVIKGKPEVVRLALVALLADGHLLIEDVPGTGKTTLARALAQGIEGTFQRVQFTSDLLPSDVIGLSAYNERLGDFEFKPGPVFANVLLADEINRTTPRTQSALLEAMAENQVTIEGTTHKLPSPFIVLATQNPLEHHGTYPLPESQLDRFMMRLTIGYPTLETEREILRERLNGRRTEEPVERMPTVISNDEVEELQRRVVEVRVDERLVDYLLRIVQATRTSETIELGVSTRGTLALLRAAQAYALLEGRSYCLPDDIKRLVVPLFAHRLVVNNRFSPIVNLSSGEEAETVLRELLKNIEVPL